MNARTRPAHLGDRISADLADRTLPHPADRIPPHLADQIPADLADRIKEVLRFDHFYSRRLRDASRRLGEASPQLGEATRTARLQDVNIAEMGIVQELLHRPRTPGWLSWRLDLDPGYLSRSLKRLEMMSLVSVGGSDDDRRMRQVSLTDRGGMVARSLEQVREDIVRMTLEELPLRQQRRLVRAMNAILGIFERDSLTNLLERRQPAPRVRP